MVKYRKKPVVVEAMTFDELVKYGKEKVGEDNLTNGMPWAFNVNGHAVSHENDECYIISTLEGTHHMTPNDMLIIGIQGEIYPCKVDIFNETYERVAI